MISDRERQEDEIFALQNICDESEFRFNKTTINIECSFSIKCELNGEKLNVEFDIRQRDLNAAKKVIIEYLPPTRFYVRLPVNYPSKCAPEYYLAINWLPPWSASLVCQRLDDLWTENEFCEILFIWMDFLKNSLLSYLHLKDTLDVSYLFSLSRDSTNNYLTEVLQWSDERVIYGGLFLDPIEKLVEYDEFAKLLEFECTIQECIICFITISGKMCVKINICNHIFCKNCIIQFLKVRIEDKNISDIKCPASCCKTTLKRDYLQEICPPDLLEKYEKCAWEIKQLSMKNLVYCPRKICQEPVYVENGENLAFCSNCEYNFCAYCFKVYHGIVPCDMNAKDKLKLIAEYQSSNKIGRQFLEKRYGRNQIKELVEKQLTKNYLEENTKPCPTCKAVITKVSGCNVMNCTLCNTNFCWLCNGQIKSDDVYKHYKFMEEGQCVGRLFEGVYDAEEVDDGINDLDLIQNLVYFMDNDFD